MLDKPVVTKIGLAIAGRGEPAYYWLRRPAGHGPGQCCPLLIALHGTDDTARQMVDFWADRHARVPTLIAAPQGIAPGWRSDDIPTIRAMLAHLRAHVPFDESRVLLAGFSAGGAMSFHLLYKEKVPVTAVAALANYVPPLITDDEIGDRRRVPVFYAVGMADVNHDRMRYGIQRLREAGGNVNLYRPRIGHVLDAGVGQAALDWFFDQCARRLDAVISKASPQGNVAEAAAGLERIIALAQWHEPAHVQAARDALGRVEAPGRRELEAARKLIAGGRGADAAEMLRKIEVNYGTSRLGRQARDARVQVESDPEVRQQLARRAARRRADEALAMYAGAQRLVAEGKLREAAGRCRRIIEFYGDTPSAERARYLLNLLEKRISP